MSVRVRPCLSVSVRVAVPCTTPAPASPPCHPFGALPEPRTLNPFHLLRPPSAGRGAEAFVWILPGSHAKITTGFFDDAAFPLPPPAFRLARLPPLRCLTLAPATPSRLQQGPNFIIGSVPAVRRTWCRGFRLDFAGFLAKITAGFFDDAALRPVRTGLVSVRDRPRSGSAEKTAVGFCAGKIQTKASLGSPSATTHHSRPTSLPTHQQPEFAFAPNFF